VVEIWTAPLALSCLAATNALFLRMAGKPLALLLSPALLLLLLLPLGGAQLERPRAYCLDSINGACIRGGEYAVERIMPARGYSGTAGQLVAVLGQRFPPPDTHPITCQLGSAAPTPARYISETELQCDVPSQGDTSVEQLSLTLDGAAFADSSMFYTFVEPEDDGLVFQGMSLLELVQYISYGTSTLWFVLTAACCVGYGYRRKQAAAAALDAATGKPYSNGSMGEGLLAAEAKRQSDAGDEPPTILKAGELSLNSEQSTCKKPKCCLFFAAASAVLALSSLGTVIFIIYANDNTVLSGGNPEFNTLAVDTSNPSALEITWEYHTEEPPETLAYEIALQDLTPPGRRLRRRMAEALSSSSSSSAAAAAASSNAVANGGWQVVYFGTDNSFSFADLAPSTEYAFRLRFHANNIPMMWSTTSVFETAQASVPATPTISAITATSATSLTVAWDEPLANGAAVANYQVREAPDGQEETTAGERVLEFDGLAQGTEYTLEVRAQNSVGWSEWGAAVAGTTDSSETPTVPDTPPTVTQAAGEPASPTQLYVDVGTFAADSGGAAALALLLEIDEPGDDEGWLPISAGLTPQVRIIDGLSASTPYAFRSAVVSSAGTSLYSPTAIIETEAASAPLAPGGLTQMTLWADRADLRWEAAADGGSPIYNYEVEVTNGKPPTNLCTKPSQAACSPTLTRDGATP
jgi:hypothetical protein